MPLADSLSINTGRRTDILRTRGGGCQKLLAVTPSRGVVVGDLYFLRCFPLVFKLSAESMPSLKEEKTTREVSSEKMVRML